MGCPSQWQAQKQLQAKSPVLALLWVAWITGFALPVLATLGLGRLAGAGPQVALGLPSVLLAGLAPLRCFLLHRKVCQREFAVGKGDPHLRP